MNFLTLKTVRTKLPLLIPQFQLLYCRSTKQMKILHDLVVVVFRKAIQNMYVYVKKHVDMYVHVFIDM